MGTSRSEDAGPDGRGPDPRPATDGGDRRPDLRIPASASGEEAAAIAAAIESYLAAQRAAAGSDGGARSWDGRRWAYAGRLGSLTGRAARVPEGAPADPWEAAGRADRF